MIKIKIKEIVWNCEHDENDRVLIGMINNNKSFVIVKIFSSVYEYEKYRLTSCLSFKYEIVGYFISLEECKNKAKDLLEEYVHRFIE